MALTSLQNGTQTATIGTEHTLGSAVVAAGTFMLSVNTTNMANGDVLEICAKTKVLTGGAEAVYMLATYAHAQGDPVKTSIPIPSLYSLTFTLKQTAGTGRAFEWNIVGL
jgi:hypothetical protein